MAEAADPARSLPDLIAAVLASLRENNGNSALSSVRQVCRACVELLPVDGASISVVLGSQHRHTLYASDTVVERIEDAQFNLGEGPCYDATRTGTPVLVPNLAESGRAWPMFSAAITDTPVAAVFAFPLARGAAEFGVLNTYRRASGWLSPAELATALQICDIATSALLAATVSGPAGEIDEAWLTNLPRHRTKVHQATGMVIAEFRVPATQALARLRAYAFRINRGVDAVAADLVAGRLPPRNWTTNETSTADVVTETH